MMNKRPNRLINEKSPYLLQHAYNPVEWFAWSPEAFEKAAKEDKPVFLSIGYATCHWCHVMESESFEDEETAGILNEHFVAVKVDREERPDIDHVYMTAVSAMTGQGGWPLSAFLTPDKKPFYGGTYFPPEPRWGSPGFKQILLSIHDNWQRQKEKIRESGDSIAAALRERAAASAATEGALDERFLSHAVGELQQHYDSRYGGFGPAPKFPTPHHILFLLRYWKRTKNTESLNMAAHTLTAMARGGLHDHLGGGFHRYSTDGKWQVPHFEKMLYDQALLARAYLEAFSAAGGAGFARTAEDIFAYVLRDMQSKEGAFFSAEDADSPDPDDPQGRKKEGAYFLWNFPEIHGTLSTEEAEIFNFQFGTAEDGNIESDPHGEFGRKNIIWEVRSIEETARHFNLPPEEIEKHAAAAKEKLFHKRQGRPRPILDDKILTDWNGLMIASLAYGARVLKEEKYLRTAERAAGFILKEMTEGDILYHRYRDGERATAGYLDDYAFFVYGLLELYEASFDERYLDRALSLSGTMVRLFRDRERGGFFLTAEGAEDLIFRGKEAYDGALPSGNSIAAGNLLRLYHMTGDGKWREWAEETLKAFSANLETHPTAYTQFLCAFDAMTGPFTEIVLAGEKGDPGFQEIREKIAGMFLPRCALMHRPPQAAELLKHAPFLEHQKPLDGKTTVYICSGHACQKPLTNLSEIISALESIR